LREFRIQTQSRQRHPQGPVTLVMDGEPPADPEFHFRIGHCFWQGGASTGMDVQLAVLENGETWGIYSSRGIVAGALIGNTSSGGTHFSGSGLDFNLLTALAANGAKTHGFIDVGNK